jgi:hypothetical protein
MNEDDQLRPEEQEAQIPLELSKSKASFLHRFSLLFLVLLVSFSKIYCQFLFSWIELCS